MTPTDARDDLRKHWHDFCDCDPFEGLDTFAERMEAAGYARLRPVKRSDIQDDPFAAERGIEPGGYLWELTAEGHKAIEAAS
jgi:hypothetical protein